MAPVGCTLAVHADWSSDPAKRWMSRAVRRDGVWRLHAPEPVGPVGHLLTGLRRQAGGGALAFGIDCPLGLPRAYVQTHLEHRDAPAGFRGFLAGLGDRPEWLPEWLHVCGTLEEVSGARPFYPKRAMRGMRRAAHATALGLPHPSALARVCDRATATRVAGAPLFWTLGANQVGKAAIAAWRDLVMPALREAPSRLHLWPFDGDLAVWASLRAPGSVLLAEVYPAEALDQLGLRLGKEAAVPSRAASRGSKRRQADRAALAPALRRVLGEMAVTGAPSLMAALQDGFGAHATGEDRFDSLLGLICLLRALHRPDAVPDDPWIRRWEGWVLGLERGKAER